MQMERRMNQSWWNLAAVIVGVTAMASGAVAAAPPAVTPPCDKYPPAKQSHCADVWKELNKEDGPIVAQFGLDQQKRREEGKITAQQHLAENMAFIKQSTEKRIERLRERMAKD